MTSTLKSVGWAAFVGSLLLDGLPLWVLLCD